MDTRKIFVRKSKLEDELTRLNEEIEQVNYQLSGLTEICNHEIVFKYTSNHPRKIGIADSYYCPACCKTIKCIRKNQIEETAFKESKIIPLTNLSLVGTSEVHDTIRNEVHRNFDYYYNQDTPVELLSASMEGKLTDLQTKYEIPTHIFVKK